MSRIVKRGPKTVTKANNLSRITATVTLRVIPGLVWRGPRVKDIVDDHLQAPDGLLVERRTRDRKGTAKECYSPELTFCADSCSVSVPRPCYRCGTKKGPGHSAKSEGGRQHLNTLTSLTQQRRSGLSMVSRHNVGTYQGNDELARNSSGNTQPQSSQLAEPLWTDPGIKSGISVRELIST